MSARRRAGDRPGRGRGPGASSRISSLMARMKNGLFAADRSRAARRRSRRRATARRRSRSGRGVQRSLTTRLMPSPRVGAERREALAAPGKAISSRRRRARAGDGRRQIGHGEHAPAQVAGDARELGHARRRRRARQRVGVEAQQLVERVGAGRRSRRGGGGGMSDAARWCGCCGLHGRLLHIRRAYVSLIFHIRRRMSIRRCTRQREEAKQERRARRSIAGRPGALRARRGSTGPASTPSASAPATRAAPSTSTSGSRRLLDRGDGSRRRPLSRRAVIGAGGAGAATVQRFVAAMASGRLPAHAQRGGVRPHQLLDACARSPADARALRRAHRRQPGAAGAEVVAPTARTSCADDVAAADVATLLLAAVIGAQTMIELEVPVDPPRIAALLLKLLAAP